MGKTCRKRGDRSGFENRLSNDFSQTIEPQQYDDMENRYKLFMQEEGLSNKTFEFQSTGSESSSSDDYSSEDLEEWMKISKNMIDSELSEDENFHPISSPTGFECDHCGKFMARKDNLVIHLWQKHTLKHPCTLCQDRFVTSFDLERHLKTHEDSKRLFICVLCGRRFMEQSFLKIHKRKDHELQLQ